MKENITKNGNMSHVTPVYILVIKWIPNQRFEYIIIYFHV